MSLIRHPRRAGLRRGTVTTALLTIALAAIAPGAIAPGAATASPSAPAAATAADIRIVGGDGSAAIVCGNVALALSLSKSKGLRLQKNNCTANAAGGSVALENVDIYVSQTARAANRNNAVLAALVGQQSASVAADACDKHRPSAQAGRQLNKCWAKARGGSVNLTNVELLSRDEAGRLTVRRVARRSISDGTRGTASARCVNVSLHALNQRDDCTGVATGALWGMTNVDVVTRRPDGTTVTSRGVNIDIRGGKATDSVYCFNVTDGTGKVKQINICSADARGGDVNLRNVRIHTES